MTKDPSQSVCPKCGSEESQRRFGSFGSARVCRDCGARIALPTPIWERLFFAALFLVPGLLLTVIAVVFMVAMAANPPANPNQTRGGGWACAFVVAGLGFFCLVQADRELRRRKKIISVVTPSDEEPVVRSPKRVRSERPSLVPSEQAMWLVRGVAAKHKARGILRKLGTIPPKHVAKAAAHFALEMGDDETPLILRDTSFLQNHRAGLLLTNRGIYSSFCPHPVWLCDIEEVCFPLPPPSDTLASLFFGELYGAWYSFKHLKQRLVVNGELVFAGNQLRAEFWVELLLILAAAARKEQPAPSEPVKENVPPPPLVLEIGGTLGGGESGETRRYDDASWEQIEQGIRRLDGNTCSSLRLWRGQPNQSLALDVLGGNGKYVLHEPGDAGWVYYDPNQGEEEVEVCTSGQGYRLPAFYVCTDVNRVLNIVRVFIDRGEFE